MVTLDYLALEIFHQQERYFETERQNNQSNWCTFTISFVTHINHRFKGKMKFSPCFSLSFKHRILSVTPCGQWKSLAIIPLCQTQFFLNPYILVFKKKKKENISYSTVLYLRRNSFPFCKCYLTFFWGCCFY